MWDLEEGETVLRELWNVLQEVVLRQGLKRINGNLPARKMGKAILIQGNSVCTKNRRHEEAWNIQDQQEV